MIRTGASIIELRDVSHAHASPEEAPAPGLREVSCAFAAGGVSLVRGPAEEGRRALFRLLGLFEAPDAGEVLVEGESTRGWSEERRAEFRMRHLGQILAAPFLLSGLSAAENVAMPLFKLIEITESEVAERTEALLEFTGLAGCGPAPAGELTLEEQYRVALARALGHRPALLLVEELDALLAGDPLRRLALLLRAASGQYDLTVIAGGSLSLPADWPDRVLDLAGGRIVADSNPARLPIEQ